MIAYAFSILTWSKTQTLYLLIYISFVTILSLLDVMVIMLFSFLLTNEIPFVPIISEYLKNSSIRHLALILLCIVTLRFFIYLTVAILQSELVYSVQVNLKSNILKSISKSHQVRLVKSDGELTKDVVIETGNFINNVVFYILQLVGDIIPFLFIVIWLLVSNFEISLALFVYLGVIVFLLQYLTRKKLSHHGIMREKNEGELLIFLSGFFKNISLLKLMNVNLRFEDIFVQGAEKIASAHFWQQFYYALPRICFESMIYLALSVFLLLMTEPSVSAIVPLGLASLRLVPIVGRLNFVYQALSFGRASYLKLSFYDKINYKSMFKNSIRIACENDQISLAKQSLKYMSSNEIVHIPSTKIRIGKMNLIVGPSGSGKSTILNALVESAGELSKVLGRFAYVPQQNEFFDGTVIENITLFDENPNEKLLKEIFSVCAIDQFLTRQEAQDTFINNKACCQGTVAKNSTGQSNIFPTICFNFR